jgi:ribonucleoside-triphosphate reductase
MSEVRISVDSIINEYLNKGDNAKENANMSFGPSGLLFNVGGEGLRRDNLNRIRKQGFGELADLHEKGGVHIHDLSLGVTTPYCAGHSLQNLLNEGISTSSVVSKPAKHLSSAINHMVNYIGANSNDFAGAQAFNDIDTFLSPYVYKCYLDYKKMGCPRAVAFKLTRKMVYQEIQSFIFHLNYNSRWGNQAPFSNITLSITIPDDLKDQLALVGGKPLQDYFTYTEDGVKVNNHTYGDLSE